MTFGIQFDSTQGTRVIDGTYLVPHLLYKINMAAGTFIDIPPAQGAQPGYTIRRYSITGPAFGTRPRMMFWTLPNTGQNIFLLAENYVEATDVYSVEVSFANGTSPTPPEGYVFCMDYVTRSAQNWGMLAYNAGGTLIFDAGNLNLSINQVLGGVSVDTTHNNTGDVPYAVQTSFPFASALPAKPAFLLPNFSADYEIGRRFTGTGTEGDQLNYRLSGNSIVTVLLRDTYDFVSDTTYSGAAYYRTYQNSPSTGLQIIAIDASLMD